MFSAPPPARPIAHLTFGLNYYYGRLGVWGYHALNVAIHLANGALVYALGLALFRRVRGSFAPGRLTAEAAPWAALAGAALFVAHPLQVESVTYIAQRANLLAAFFSLSALLLYLRGRSAARFSARAGLWMAAGACWLLALGSHESALGFPLAIALTEWFFGDDLVRRSALRWLRLAVALALGAAVWSLGQARAIALYESLVLLPLPSRLNVAHDLGVTRSLFDPPVTALVLALHAALLGSAAVFARRFRVASFALLWFYLHHALAAYTVLPPIAAEHRNYLPLVGPCLAAGFLLFAALPSRLGLATAVAVFAVATLGAATHARNEVWRSRAALSDDAVAKSPRNASARIERGALLEEQGRHEEALADFREAVRIDPGSARARARLAASLVGFGYAREALPHAREAAALDPTNAAAHAALGRIEAALGEHETAVAAYQRALALGRQPALERRIGDSLLLLGRFEEAISHYRQAIAIDPGDDDARVGAGAALVELGRASDALAYLEEAVESQPNPRYLAHFADALWQQGDHAAALDALSTAVRVAPDWPGATSRLAWMLATIPDAERRDPERAQRIARAALAQLGGPDAALQDALAAALAAAGRFEEARAEAERAAEQASADRDAALAAAISARARGYARREVWREPPRPFEANP